MRKLIILASVLSLTACTTVPDQKPIDAKMVIGAVALIAVAGYLGKENQKSKCENNRAGFWQDHSTGKIYTC